MSLQKRLLLYLAICAPLVWLVAVLVSVNRAEHEVNEMFDSELIRLARQLQVMLPSLSPGGGALAELPPSPPEGSPGAGESDVGDLAIAVWDASGKMRLSDREGVELVYRPERAGFVNDVIHGDAWRVYYLQSLSGQWLVAVGQRSYERDELVFGLTAGQLVPWLLVLPVLLVVMAWGVRRALAPLHQLAGELETRTPDDLHPLGQTRTPAELKPMVKAMNGLFARIGESFARERRFTADAAHELRTPLAVLRAQWDVVRRAGNEAERAESERKFVSGLERTERLVTQMLMLSRLDATAPSGFTDDVDWHAVVEAAVNDCLALAGRRRVEIAVEWPDNGRPPLPLLGSAPLLTALLRNLLDNALRYAPADGSVALRFGDQRLVVENDCEPLQPELFARLGERFYRPEGQHENGSGLGVSIVMRIAALHRLVVSFGPVADGRGMRVALDYAPAID